jgi:predicted O-methyltransferase YrrM
MEPSHILNIGMGFFASKTLLSAMELGLYTKLGKSSLTRQEIEVRLNLHPRASEDFLDTLVSLGLLARDGLGDQAKYRNTAETAAFLDRASLRYLGGILEMANHRLYHSWGSLTEALQTGKPQNEIKTAKNKADLFTALYENPQRLEEFMSAMAGIQMGNFMALAEKFDFTKHKSVCDVGGASGACSIAIARKHPLVKCISYDLPQVAPIAKRVVEAAGLSAQVSIQAGDCFSGAYPKAGVITMGNVLHDWDLAQKKLLIQKAFDILPPGGCLIAIENVIDDERKKNAFGLMMSLNMLIETEGGFDYTGAQFKSWCLEAGFKSTEVMPLTGPASAAIAYK